MDAQETTKILMAIQTLWGNFRVPDKSAAVQIWAEYLGDLSYQQVSQAIREFAQTDTKGFPPTVGQIRAIVVGQSREEIGEGEAWNLVYNALQNGYYGAEEEFNKLPEDVRRALGGASQLRQWAVMDIDSISVAESNFKRSYRAVVESRQKYERLCANDRPKIGVAPMAMIEAKEEEPQTERASNEYIDRLLEKWRADDPKGTRS